MALVSNSKSKYTLRDLIILNKIKGSLNTLKSICLHFDYVTYNSEEGVYRNGRFIPTIEYNGKSTIRKVTYPYRELDIQTIVFEICPEDTEICITQFICFNDEDTLFYKAKRRNT